MTPQKTHKQLFGTHPVPGENPANLFMFMKRPFEKHRTFSNVKSPKVLCSELSTPRLSGPFNRDKRYYLCNTPVRRDTLLLCCTSSEKEESEKHRAREPRNLTHELSHESAHDNVHGSVHEDAHETPHES